MSVAVPREWHEQSQMDAGEKKTLFFSRRSRWTARRIGFERRDAPTSPSTVHSSRLPRFPGRGPLGATAASVAGSGGVPGALGGGRVALPPLPRDWTRALETQRGERAEIALLRAGEVARVLSPSWLVATEPSGLFTLRTRILRRGAGLPPGASRGPGGPRGRSPTAPIARLGAGPVLVFR